MDEATAHSQDGLTWVSGAWLGPQQLAAPSASQRAVDPMVGRMLAGRFRIDQRIAKGGMGRVYRAWQEPLGRWVAIKVLDPVAIARATHDFHRRFLLEASMAARLSHPHTVTVLDYGQDDDGSYFLVMEYLRGETLADLLGREGALPAARALRLAGQVAWAVAQAHAQGAIHRDLKPANIFLQQLDGQTQTGGAGNDFVKVVDFGLVKQFGALDEDLTHAGQFLGSPGYMAPEQIRGQAVDGRCDIYALGAVLFEMLAGAAPFVRNSPLETMVAHVHEPLPHLGAKLAAPWGWRRWHADLEAVVVRAMHKDPEARFGTMADMQAALATAATTLSGAPGAAAAPVAMGEGHSWAEVSVRRAFEPRGGRAVADALPEGAPPAARAPAPAPTTCMHPYFGLGERPEIASTPQAPSHAAGVTARVPARAGRWRRGRRQVAAAMLGATLLVAVGATVWPRTPVALTLRSAPDGAEVWLGNRKLCAHTPCQVEFAPQLRQRSVSLQFRYPGLDSYVATRRITGPHLAIECVLDDDPKDGHEHLDQNEPHDGDLDAHGLL